MTAWNGDVLGRLDLPTQYQINLTGAQAIPEPGSGILLGAGLVLLLSLARRAAHRRRSSVTWSPGHPRGARFVRAASR